MAQETKNQKGFWTTSLGKTLSFLGKYTGILWLLSGLKRVFGGQPPKFSAISVIAEGRRELYLFPTEAHNLTLNESVKKSKFRVSISTDKRKCNITGSGPYVTSDARLCYKISSVASQDHDASDKLKKMKGKLGFTDKTKDIQVTKMSKAQFKVPEIKSSARTVGDEAQLTNPEQSCIKVTDQGQLRLYVTTDHMLTVGSSTNSQNRNEYLVHLTIVENTYRIIGKNDFHFINNQQYCLINSVANQDGTDASNDPLIMMKKLGLVGEKKFVNITEMSKAPFKVPEAALINSSPDKEPRSTSGDPKLQQLTSKTKPGP